MPRGGHGVNKMPARAQHTGKLGLGHGREDVQKQVGPAVAHRCTKAATDTERRVGHELRRQPHGLLGQVERRNLRAAQRVIQILIVAALSAAGVHNMVMGQRGAKRCQRRHQRGVVPCRQERAAGADHGLAVAGVGGVLLLHRQQVGVALFGKVKAVGSGTAQAAPGQQQRPAAYGAAQGCRGGGGHSAASAGVAVSGVSAASDASGGSGTVIPPWAAR